MQVWHAVSTRGVEVFSALATRAVDLGERHGRRTRGDEVNLNGRDPHDRRRGVAHGDIATKESAAGSA